MSEAKEYYIPALNKTKIFNREGCFLSTILSEGELHEVGDNLKSVFPEGLTPITTRARRVDNGYKVFAIIKEWDI